MKILDYLKEKLLGDGISLRVKITMLVAVYLTMALAVLSGIIIQLQQQAFLSKSEESAREVINELSSTLYHKWSPKRTTEANRAAIGSYHALSDMVFRNDSMVYVVFQDSKGEIQYIAKSLNDYVWMMNHSRLDPYALRRVSITGFATRSFASYPEGRVTEYIGSVYGKEKELLGFIRVGVSEKTVLASMGQMTRNTVIKIIAVNVLILSALLLAAFYAASALEMRLNKIHTQAKKMLPPSAPTLSPSPLSGANVLVELSRELEEVDQFVQGLKHKFMELASTISHEFRSPMQAIQGYTDFLRRGGAGKVTPEMDKYLKIIGENSERFQGFIDNVMDLVRLDGGKLQFEPVSFPAAEPLGKIAEFFSKQAAESGISIKLQLSAPELHAFGDPNRVYQVLFNLVSNALKFTPVGGCIELMARENNGFVEFFVKDNGPGIAAESQARLFTEFYQVTDTEPVRGFKGLGIGLALCKKLVRAQNGSIRLESESGKGVTVSFTIPVALR